MTSDHLPILIEINSDIKKILNEDFDSSIKTYFLNKANWNLFSKLLPEYIPISVPNNVEELNKFVVNSLLEAADKSIPQDTHMTRKKFQISATIHCATN